MISISTFITYGIITLIGLLGPTAIAIWWVKSRKEKLTTVLLGSATWFIFAIILESIPKLLLFNKENNLGKSITENVFLFTAVGAILAGVFEETGRLVVFLTLLRNNKNRETSISHGIGHGGFEAMFIMVSSGIQMIVFSVLINKGLFPGILDQAAAAGADISSLQSLPEQIMSYTPAMALLVVWERASAMLLHIGLSIMVFYSVKRRRPLLFIQAVILHALFDVPAALYQFGTIKNLYIIELMLTVYAVLFIYVTYKKLYKEDIPEM